MNAVMIIVHGIMSMCTLHNANELAHDIPEIRYSD